MPSLAELQTAFAQAALGQESEIGAWVRGGGLAPAQRIQVYRNAVRVRLKDALADTYPVLRRLVGEACFDGVASELLARYPPRAGYLHPFGAEMPQLCAQLPALAGLPYLPDVARLEWNWQRAFHGSGAPPLAPQAFAGIADGRQAAIRLHLQENASLLRSLYPVMRIVEVNQPDYCGDDAISLDQGGETLLIIRRGIEVRIERLSPGEYALLSALARDAPLGEALRVGIDAEPGCAIGALLARHVAAGTFAHMAVEGDAQCPTFDDSISRQTRTVP